MEYSTHRAFLIVRDNPGDYYTLFMHLRGYLNYPMISTH
jgi:hypothetical protein